MSILRPYQRQAITASWAAITPETNRVAIEMATGLGKTITFGAMIDEYLDGFEGAGNRVLVLVHTDELVRQAVDKIRLMADSRPWTIGIVKAKQDDVDADIIVASVRTLAKPERRDRITDVGLIIVDEAHHAVATTYVDILEHYGALPTLATSLQDSYSTLDEDRGSPGAEVGVSPEAGHLTRYKGRGVPVPTFGFTATPARTDGRGLGTIWQDLAFSRSLPWAIRHGWLIDLVPYTIKIPGVSASSSDAELDAQLADSIAPEAVVKAWLDHGITINMKDRDNNSAPLFNPLPSTVLFAPLVRSAEAFAEAFNAAGVKAEVVHGNLSPAERQAVLDRYEAGVTTVVCNAMVLTEGWDSPRTMCVVVARPTQSVPLFIQMIGRGLRPWLSADAPSREEQQCVLLCVAGSTTDLVTVADLSDKIEEVQDGKTFLAMEDEFDLFQDMLEDEDNAYRGPVRVEQWDAIVQRSSKAWKYTVDGAPYLPTAKRSQGYVFVVQVHSDEWGVYAFGHNPRYGRSGAWRVATAPDMELAMALAEDEAQERGGDIGALLADKTRPWRKKVPSMEALAQARRVGIAESEIKKILDSRSAGKAGKLSDLIDKVIASRVLDPNVRKIRERGSK